MKLFKKTTQIVGLSGPIPLHINLRDLSEGEYLQVRYNPDKLIFGIRKLKLLSARGIAKAETDILPGKACGRVLYEGQSWQACCEGERAILKGQSALVLAKQGLQLIVTADEASA